MALVNVDRIMDKLEGVLVPAVDGGVTLCDYPRLDAEEILFLLSFLGRSREQVLARVSEE